MFIINPDPYSLPCYHIGPFTAADVGLNNHLPNDDSIEDYFSKRFKGSKYYYTLNGRQAINIALSQYHLQKDDIVTILTTTGNFYISSCVTKEIEKFCKWSRRVDPGTKVILVNHEFGYPYKNLLTLKKKGIPIIEDCAHAFFSKDQGKTIGTAGDFVIYSFPKIFPLQLGGLLVSNIDCKLSEKKLLGKAEKRYIKNVLSHYIKIKDRIIKRRLINYSYLSQKFKEIGLIEHFKLVKGIIPGVFMFRKGRHKIELPELKKYFYAHGVQCSVFYGEESFFIPVHQNLTKSDCDYFIAVLQEFLRPKLK